MSSESGVEGQGAARVALVSHSTTPRGGHVHTLGLAEALHRAGRPVHVVALGDPAAGLYRPSQAAVSRRATPSEETWPSWRDGHTHLYLYSFDKANPLTADAKLVNQITKGDFEVFDVEGVVENTGTLFLTTNAGDDRQRHLCSVKLDGAGFQCLTKGGTHAATVAPNGQYFVDHFSALMTPPQLSFCHVGGSCDVFWRSKSVDGLARRHPDRTPRETEGSRGPHCVPRFTTRRVHHRHRIRH